MEDALDQYTIDYIKEKAEHDRTKICTKFIDLFLRSIKEASEENTKWNNQVLLRRLVNDYARNYHNVLILECELKRLTPFKISQ
jgi:hypothetical protein